LASQGPRRVTPRLQVGLRRCHLFTPRHSDFAQLCALTNDAACVVPAADYLADVALEFKGRSWQRGAVGSLASLTLACSGAPNSDNPNPQASDATSTNSASTAGPSTTSITPATSSAISSSSAATPSPSVTSTTSTQPAPTSDATSSSSNTSASADDATSSDGDSSRGGSDDTSAPLANSEPAASSGDTDTATSERETSGGQDSASTDGCVHHGNVSYTLNNPEAWPDDVVQKLTAALDEAIYYYNCYSDLTKALNINYKPDVPTAEGNVDGWISFGSDRNYMQTATTMHEIGHTMGVGYAPWSEFIQDGKWTGPAVVEFMTNLPAEQRDPDMYSQRTYITCDTQHFWPYGLNQASEHQSEWSLINHVRIVAAMNVDKDSVR
jgi:hypothetical protein